MRVGIATILIGTIFPAMAFAHAIGAEAKLTSGRVHVEAYFDDDSPAREARVTVTDAAKNTIVQGRTDAAGKWSFAAPAPGNYVVVVDAGDGHRTEVRVTIPGLTDQAMTVSDGPGRNEFTRTRWVGLLVGVLLIAFVVIGSKLQRRRRPISDGSLPNSI